MEPEPAGPQPRETDSGEGRATQWLSRGLEALIEGLGRDATEPADDADFDVLVVGSGYGGAIAAAELARHRGTRRVCVLERGRERLPGAFPSRMAELAGHVRFSTQGSSRPRGRREGLFDLRLGEDLCALVANGVGGGSLINAGVMVMPPRAVLESRAWPKALRDPSSVEGLLATGAALASRLGATATPETPGSPLPLKFKALQALAGRHGATTVPITVAPARADAERIPTPAGVAIDACVGCGGCFTGCNYNAKVSLDVTLLAEARRAGAEIYAGATVLKLERLARCGAGPAWQVTVVHTDEVLRRREPKPFLLSARRVVLAAGTFGSTEILMRSRSDSLRWSPKLGHQVSANGDLIAAAYDTRAQANCAALEQIDPRSTDPGERVGPTITGMIDLRSPPGGGVAPRDDDLVIQDLAIPAPLRRLLEETVTTTAALQRLPEADTSRHGDPRGRADPCAVNQDAVRRTLTVAIIGHDSADGVMLFEGKDDGDGDGAIRVRWPSLRHYPPLLARHRRFESLLRSSIGGQALPNPLWRPLPDKLEFLLGAQAGPLLTVHPLGGCPMGDDSRSGVVDDLGRVFDGASPTSTSCHPGLVVLDGAIIPTSLGINPALTIASVAMRAVTALRAQWGYDTPDGATQQIGDRPVFREPQPPARRRPTRVEMVERLSGPLVLDGVGRPGKPVHVELTLRFASVSVAALASGTTRARLTLPPGGGRLRIFECEPPDDREAPDDKALLVASLGGTLRVFHEEESTSLARRIRGAWAWFRNRGLRDGVLWAIDRVAGNGPMPTGETSAGREALRLLRIAWDVSSRAGAVRRLDYDLAITNVEAPGLAPGIVRAFKGGPIVGSKRLTYSRRGNPWRQLMEVALDSFPLARGTKRALRLDAGFLARQGVPLMRIVRQEDQPTALVDIAALLLYLTRMLLHVHAWSFRAPDLPRARTIERLPGIVPGLPPPIVHEFQVAAPREGIPVMVRLTHYPAANRGGGEGATSRAEAPPAGRPSTGREASMLTPVLLIHGYSASGTTFAHHSVRPNLASALWARGKDVWIADLRTSAGMPHARAPWTFEEVALTDIPVAVEQVVRLTGVEKIDVFAHCIGSAMFGMALLAPAPASTLHQHVRRLAMSQVAPAMLFTPANVFRAYAMRYLKHYLPLTDYQFRPSRAPTLLDQLIDRLLATLPYPEEEFDRENPLWTPWRRTPWVGTRHRMDALYGRDFSVNNLPQGVLDYIDDHFGPLNVDTVSQAIHFAHNRVITNRTGFNEYVTPQQLRARYDFPILHVHGKENGLVSWRTPRHFRKVLRDADERFDSRAAMQIRMYPAGHQDSLIGRGAGKVFEGVIEFFETDEAPAAKRPGEDAVTASTPRITFAAQVPAYGVRLGVEDGAGGRVYSFGDHGGRGDVIETLLVPVAEEGGRYLPVDSSGRPVEPTAENLKGLVGCVPAGEVWTATEARRWRFDPGEVGRRAGDENLLVLALYNQSTHVGPSERLDGFLNLEALARGLAEQIASDPSAKGTRDGVVIVPIELDGLIQRVVDALVECVREVFVQAGSANLSQGILRRAKVPPGEPRSRESATCFALASCQYPGGMLDRTPPGVPHMAREGPADASYLRLLAALERRRGPVPTELILTGDQVYVDATAGLFDPKIADDRFRLAYQAAFAARGPRMVLSRLPAIMRLDDHEIEDNWLPPRAAPKGSTEDVGTLGIRAYLRNQRDVDPCDGKQRVLWDADGRINGFPCFLADARSRRSPRDVATVGKAGIMDLEQERALDRWLADTKGDGPKFLVSGSMVLPRRLEVRDGAQGGMVNVDGSDANAAAALRSDAWDGFPASLHRLLAGAYRRGLDDLVFLSGDEHISNVTEIRIKREGSSKVVVAHSIHSSALYAPYPFANGIEADFANRERFRFRHDGHLYTCFVKAWHAPAGDGFATIEVVRNAADWTLAVRFDRADLVSRKRARREFSVPLGASRSCSTG